ncbi:MAG: hypothetical protein JSV09_12295 [Thermoplasmata archaeon]|nr:MAG: hypothetical protein JSV09_12295 [Thermoplasmata archaeon]
MICKFDDGKGWCTEQFKGFGCIKEKCDNYTPAIGDGEKCKGIEGKGTYCHRYNRFYCAGKENCTDSTRYIKKLKMSMC